jgi:hypothetical protein
MRKVFNRTIKIYLFSSLIFMAVKCDVEQGYYEEKIVKKYFLTLLGFLPVFNLLVLAHILRLSGFN